MGDDTKIHVAFRFHVNFYHSYRGDRPDESGFGKDIRIIRNTLSLLDGFNAAGVPVCGTWDLENCFSLETIMPEHCPDIIEAIRRRAGDGRDEIEIMSYNNGLLSASNAAEFEQATLRAVTNDSGSGVRDLFGGCAPVVRPQEMMYTPSFIRLYRRYGIEALSLYYSAIPFTCFVPKLTVRERFNPLVMKYPGMESSLTVLPAHNHGDLVDNLSLRCWLKRLRKSQMAMKEPSDLLMLLDFDADDEFWIGMDIPVLKNLFSILRGLGGMINSIKDLPFVKFTTPYRYLSCHPPVGEITVGQDTADGSFDGFASWSEKWSNHQLWTGIERSRVLEMQSFRLAELLAGQVPPEARALMKQSFEDRLKALSTTHFGMSAPVMNRPRLEKGADLVHGSVDKAKRAFDMLKDGILKAAEDGTITILDYTRGVPTQAVAYKTGPSKTLMRLNLARVPERGSVALMDDEGNRIESAVIENDTGAELLFLEESDGAIRRRYRVTGTAGGPAQNRTGGVKAGKTGLSCGPLSVVPDIPQGAVSITGRGDGGAWSIILRSAITYGGRRYDSGGWEVVRAEEFAGGQFGLMKMRGRIEFDSRGTKRAGIEREFVVCAGLPYLYCAVTVGFPRTAMRKYDRDKAKRLQRKWDGNWQEVMPCELMPEFTGSKERPLRVWKHNYFGDISSFGPDYGAWSKNRELDSVNNQITCGWVAVSDGKNGLLLAQSADSLASMAFCPMRTRLAKGGTRVYLNPFGSYTGRQYRYPSAYTGLGRKAAVSGSASDHLKPYAPSYNGRELKFSLMIAPYSGDKPDEKTAGDAMAFSYPYMVLSKSDFIREQAHRSWDRPAFSQPGDEEAT